MTVSHAVLRQPTAEPHSALSNRLRVEFLIFILDGVLPSSAASEPIQPARSPSERIRNVVPSAFISVYPQREPTASALLPEQLISIVALPVSMPQLPSQEPAPIQSLPVEDILILPLSSFMGVSQGETPPPIHMPWSPFACSSTLPLTFIVISPKVSL